MPDRYWTLTQELGGMEKWVLLLVERNGVISTDEIKREIQNCSTGEGEAILDKLEATGLISGIDEITIRQQMLLMDWARDRDMIGTTCMDEDGAYLHPPEQCQEELHAFAEWERDLREAGDWIYRMILDAATDRWRGGLGDAWLGGRTMEERTAAWVEWRRSALEVGG